MARGEMKKMTISIIIPVHNSEKYLEQCIESVMRQLTNEDEVILVENGSTDNSLQKCRKYAEKYKNIKLIKLGKVGVAVARNEGISHSRKEWVTFLDSDDMIQPKVLQDFRNLDGITADIIIAGYSREIVKKKEELYFSEIDTEILTAGVLQWAKYRKKIQKVAPVDNYNNWACWGKLYRRDFLIDNKIEFPAGITHSEDTAFCFQAYLSAKQIIAISEKLYYYRENFESVTNIFSERLLENNIKLIEVFEKYRKHFYIPNRINRAFDNFYARKVVEICCEYFKSAKCSLNEQDKAMALKNICEKNVIRNAIKRADYFRIIIGKKNTLKYAYILWQLKHRQYKTAVKI